MIIGAAERAVGTALVLSLLACTLVAFSESARAIPPSPPTQAPDNLKARLQGSGQTETKVTHRVELTWSYPANPFPLNPDVNNIQVAPPSVEVQLATLSQAGNLVWDPSWKEIPFLVIEVLANPTNSKTLFRVGITRQAGGVYSAFRVRAAGGTRPAPTIQNGRLTRSKFPMKGPYAEVVTTPFVETPVPDQKAKVGMLFSYQLADNTFGEAYPDVLTYTATKGDGTALPDWLSFDAATRTFSGRPGENDRTVAVEVTATHHTASTKSTFNIAVDALDALRVTIRGVPATTNGPFTATFTFSESVTGFVVDDIAVTGATVSNFSGMGTTYRATITPSGDYSVQVVANVAQDADGKDNIATRAVGGIYDTAPTFTSVSSVRVAENERDVLVVRARAPGPDGEDGALRYRLSGGADQSWFSIDPATGALTFTRLPDYENPSDSGGDNGYVVTVQATSGADGQERSAEQTITVTVTDVKEIVLKPGTPVTGGGPHQQERTTIRVTDTASVAVSVTLPDAIVDADGVALPRVDIMIADAPSTPLPERTSFGFDAETRVNIEVSPVPEGGIEVCLPVSEALRAASGRQPLTVLHFSGGMWRALPGTDKGSQVCASGVSVFRPFMAGFQVVTGERASLAWLARFGRTVTDQVLDAVSGRLAAPRSAGVEVNLAGRALPVWSQRRVAPEYGSTEDAPASAATHDHAVAGGLRASPAKRGSRDALRSWLSHTGAGDDHDTLGRIPGSQFWSPTSRDFVSASSFALTGESGADGALPSFWGRGSLARFDGRDGDLSLDGEATTLLVGADRSWQSHTVGAMLGRSRVKGGYRSSAESGEIEATLTGVYPYTGLVVRERLSAWAVAGYGAGGLTLKPEKSGGSIRADLALEMVAAGVRGEALRAPQAGGLSLAVKGDMRITRVSSDAAGDALTGRLLAAEAEVWRVRAGVEGARSFALDEKGGIVTPSFEVGARFDGGDAETGFGADIGGGGCADCSGSRRDGGIEGARTGRAQGSGLAGMGGCRRPSPGTRVHRRSGAGRCR